tara:strand:+ start:2884 stop:3135 length:252 start_codon:yes stop_codon:yes gene_type:complete
MESIDRQKIEQLEMLKEMAEIASYEELGQALYEAIYEMTDGDSIDSADLSDVLLHLEQSDVGAKYWAGSIRADRKNSTLNQSE